MEENLLRMQQLTHNKKLNFYAKHKLLKVLITNLA
ncbi:N-acetylmuramoyl-L-alanine amidase [Listeria monocytogenes]|nr:N-acetylmuramoyl-L-alanine amidase [Listeria monocytogenes]